MRIEASRKHGPFDPRFRPRLAKAPPEVGAPSAPGLGWLEFHAQLFESHGRHDGEALAAYAAYRAAA